MVSQTAIFGPVFATMLLTFVVWLTLYVRRIRFKCRSNPRPSKYSATASCVTVVEPSES